ncbi:MAG: PhzF family phenazine biosynthesis protein [Alphaproteobacteria bacterium]|nr:PhzF family phenazine biosynthesis protein [Alphaproteobacteria bacterium]
MPALSIYQVDAFTSHIFGGNPAAVVPLEAWLPDSVMQNIAIENNLSETAFFIPDGDGFYLRWFTPTYEIDLCGHATLATAFVILTQLYPERESVTFKTNVAGDLIVRKNSDALTMDFPVRAGEKIDIKDIPALVLESLGSPTPIEAYKARDLMLVYDNEEFVRNAKPDFSKLIQYPDAVIITSKTKDKNYDFISRFFCPYDMGIPEDPVTGSAHCTLTPYWAKRLSKHELKARQVSERGGDLDLKTDGDRLYITGKAVLYMVGKFYI